MFAVIEEGNKQFLVRKGNVIAVEKRQGEIGSVITIPNVLSVNGEFSEKALGSATVKAEVLDQRKDDKIIIFKKKRRQNYRRKNGHRQQITVLRIAEISL